MAELDGTAPVEVWLTQTNMKVTCRIVYEDESTDERDVDSLSIRGAQREWTGYLIKQGYEPAGRWENETDGEAENYVETSRKFRPSKTKKEKS